MRPQGSSNKRFSVIFKCYRLGCLCLHTVPAPGKPFNPRAAALNSRLVPSGQCCPNGAQNSLENMRFMPKNGLQLLVESTVLSALDSFSKSEAPCTKLTTVHRCRRSRTWNPPFLSTWEPHRKSLCALQRTLLWLLILPDISRELPSWSAVWSSLNPTAS
jgi:hypothetical protein